LEQKAKIVIRAAVDENGQCVVITPKKLDGLCGTGCTNDVIKGRVSKIFILFFVLFIVIP